MDAERAKTILLSCKCVQEEDITILTPQEMHLGLEVQDIKCDIAIMDIEYEKPAVQRDYIKQRVK